MQSNHSAFLFHELIKAIPSQSGKRRIDLAKGEQVFEEGQHAKGLFCVISGKIKISRLSDTGKEVIVRLASSGDVIGYRALVAGENYHASATTLENTVVGFVPDRVFFDVLSSNKEVSMSVMKLLCHDLDKAEGHQVDITTKSVHERVAEILLLFKETYGVNLDGSIDVSMSRKDLASMVGAAPEVVIRSMQKMREENIISTQGRKIFLIDVPALVKIAKLND